jgi:hypothetical protein
MLNDRHLDGVAQRGRGRLTEYSVEEEEAGSV